MYSANLHDQLINAAFPLKPLTAWAGGACTVTVAVPQVQSLAGITVESVTVRLTLPTGAVVTQAATAVADSPNWAATFAADNFSTSGFVAEGFVVNIVGKDETGTSRVWIVSKGDLEIRPGDASPSPGGSYVVVKLHDAAPSTPVDGDAYISGGKLYLYDGTAWHAIGGTSVQVDPTLTMQGAAADAKAVGDALAGKLDGAAAYPAWEPSNASIEGMIKSHAGKLWKCLSSTMDEPSEISEDWRLVTIDSLKQDALSSAQIANIAAVPGKADKAVPSAAGNLASLTAQGNLADSGAKPSDFAAKADLPYRLVEPGEWEFSGVPSGWHVVSVWYGGRWRMTLQQGDDESTRVASDTLDGNETALVITIYFDDPGCEVTATRASLPGHLLDRANNLIDASSGNVTLTLPEYRAGKLRDLLVYVDLGDDGTDPYSITFNFPSGESNTGFKAEGDDPTSATFPAPTAAGEWWYSFTECKPHKFAVSLKQLQDAPQAQGGS